MYIQDIPKDKKFWVIRSGDAGVFYEHFVHNSIVAIGHIDKMDFNDKILGDENDVIKLVLGYKNKLIENKETLASASNKAGQVLRFINEISIGDIVISLDAKRIIVGIVASNAYKEVSDVSLKNVDGTTSDLLLKFSLRRKVSWGKTQFRNNLPLAINNSFRANQTVFSANEHWKALNHWLSVAFISDGDAYISSRIEQKEGINNLDIAQYAIIINKIEAIGETIANKIHSNQQENDLLKLFESTYNELRKNRTFTVTTQQVFLSPGDLWAKSSGNRNKSLIIISAFLLMFNIEPSFANSADQNFIDNHREAITTMVNKIKEDESFTEVKNGLALNIPPQKIDENKNPKAQQKIEAESNNELDDFEGM